MRIVLAPVDEDLARPQILGHLGDDLLRQLGGEPLGQGLCVRRGRLRILRPDPGVELHSLAAAGFRQRREPVAGEHVVEPLGDAAAVDHGRPRARVEVEYQAVGGLRFAVRGHFPLRYVQLQRRQVGRPHQLGQVVDQRVRDDFALLAASAEGERREPDPIRGMAGDVLFEERTGADAVREAHEGHRPILDVRQQQRRDARVVVEDLTLGEPAARVEHLA